MAYEHERDEWRAAVAAERRTNTDCHRHDYRPDRSGGGTCAGCGDSIDRGEL